MSGLGEGEKTGIKTVLEEEFRPSDPVPGTAGQQAALPLCETGTEETRAEPDPAPRGPGRPAGAKNKNTEEWRRYLLSKYSSPLEGLFQVAAKSEAEIARDLGLKTDPNYAQALELFKLRLQCMKEALPYVHQKQPLAVENTGNGLMTLVINSGGPMAEQAENAGVMAVDFIDAETVENQEVSAGEAQEFDAQEFDAQGQSIETTNENQTKQSD